MRPIIERILGAVFRISRYYAWWVIFIALVLTGTAAYYVTDLPIRSSFLDLLPSNDPLIDDYRRNEQYLAQSDFVPLLVTLLEGEDRSDETMLAAQQELEALERKEEATQKERARIKELTQQINNYRESRLLAAAEAIAKVLRENPEFIGVTYLIEPSPEIPDQYLLLFQLDEKKLAQIESSVALAHRSIANGELSLIPTTDNLSDAYRKVGEAFGQALSGGSLGSGNLEDPSDVEAELAGLIALNDTILGTINGIDTFPTVTEAVRGLAEIFTPSAEEISREPEGVFSRDGTRLLMTVQPRYPAQRGVAYCTLVMKSLEDALAQVDLDRLGVTVGITGTYAFAASTNAVVNADMLRTTIISSIGVVLIFFVAFGSIFYSIIAIIPLLISVVLTMAWAKLTMGGFNLITSFLPALVLGLGIDYGIHLISRYAEERSKGISLNRALHTAVLRKGEASLVAAMTTALVFVGLLFARSRALFEMGAITSMGVILAFLATLFLIPALITLSHFIFRAHQRERVVNYATHLSGYFRFVTAKGRVIFVIVLTLTFFVAFQAAHTAFQFSSEDLIPRVESQEVLDDILAHFGASSTQIGNYFTFFASSEEELTRVVEHLERSDFVQGVGSARDLLPVNLSEQQQVLNSLDIASYIDQLDLLNRSLTERVSVLAQIRTLLTQFGLLQYAAALNGRVEIALASNEVQRQLRETQKALNRLKLEESQALIFALKEALHELDNNLLQIRELPPIETLLRDILKGLPEGIRNGYITPDDKYIIRARMSPQLLQGKNLQEFNTFAASFSDNYFGMPLVGEKLESYMKRDFLISTLLAAILITFTLWRTLHGGMRALLAATPLVLGYIWMLGGMRLLQIDFNFINIMISPLLIGIGVDNGIHILHRYKEERALNPEGAIERGGRTTAVAVIVTSLTTMLVFGSLLLARTPGLRLLGSSALLGIGFTLIFSLLFLPAALHIEGGKRV